MTTVNEATQALVQAFLDNILPQDTPSMITPAKWDALVTQSIGKMEPKKLYELATEALVTQSIEKMEPKKLYELATDAQVAYVTATHLDHTGQTIANDESLDEVHDAAVAADKALVNFEPQCEVGRQLQQAARDLVYATLGTIR